MRPAPTIHLINSRRFIVWARAELGPELTPDATTLKAALCITAIRISMTAQLLRARAIPQRWPAMSGALQPKRQPRTHVYNEFWMMWRDAR